MNGDTFRLETALSRDAASRAIQERVGNDCPLHGLVTSDDFEVWRARGLSGPFRPAIRGRFGDGALGTTVLVTVSLEPLASWLLALSAGACLLAVLGLPLLVPPGHGVFLTLAAVGGVALPFALWGAVVVGFRREVRLAREVLEATFNRRSTGGAADGSAPAGRR